MHSLAHLVAVYSLPVVLGLGHLICVFGHQVNSLRVPFVLCLCLEMRLRQLFDDRRLLILRLSWRVLSFKLALLLLLLFAFLMPIDSLRLSLVPSQARLPICPWLMHPHLFHLVSRSWDGRLLTVQLVLKF